MYMRRLLYSLAWFLLTGGIMLVIAGTGQSLLLSKHFEASQPETTPTPNPIASASDGVVLGTTQTNLDSQFRTMDARAQIVSNFLERHNSPLQPYDYFGHYLVEIADKQQIDFRLLPAIAMQESNLCKRIPPGSYNCLGFGIHERGTLHFESYEANFERAARELKQFYIEEGRVTPELIMKKYTPSSNGSWANSVNQWMTEMEYDDRQKGRELKSSQHVLEYVPVQE